MDTTDANAGNENQEAVAARVIGLDETESNLLIAASDQKFSVPVDEELLRLIRRAQTVRAAAAHDSAPPARAAEFDGIRASDRELTPCEMQARIRAGETPEEIAAVSSTDIETIRRFESPILAEREFMIEQAQASAIAQQPEAPALGGVVVDRLAARGVASEDIEWSAYRLPGSQWTIEVQFQAGDRDRSASWSFEPRSQRISALDDEARWLTETEEPRDEPIPARLAPVRDWVYDVDSDGGVVGADGAGAAEQEEEPDDSLARQQDLLDELSSRRGRRQPVSDEQDPFELLGEIPAAHPPASRPDLAVDAEILQLPDPEVESISDEEAAAIAKDIADVEAQPADGEPVSATEEPEDHREESEKAERPTRRSNRNRRTSVPSWDEIVFGARTY